MLIHETDFEEQYINNIYGRDKIKAYVKCGLTSKDVIGIKLQPVKDEDDIS